MRWLLRRLLVPLFLLAGIGGLAHASEPALVIVSSERSAAYQEAQQALQDELGRPGTPAPDVQQLTAAELASQRLLMPRLFVALGSEACAVLARSEPRSPVLCTLLPRASFERVLRDSDRRVSGQFSALYLNQPLTRQLDLVRLALPQVRSIGVLWGPESQQQEASLEVAAQARGLKLVGAVVRPDEPIFSGLKKILPESNLLLAVADPQIYNSSSIQNILMTSYRAQVPMLAFSPAYVRAGALLSVHSTPGQIGHQAGLMARAVLQGRPLGAPQYPHDFSVSVNEHVARSLGLSLDAQVLTERLKRQEKSP